MRLSDLKHDITYFKFYIKGLYHLFTKNKWKETQRRELIKIL